MNWLLGDLHKADLGSGNRSLIGFAVSTRRSSINPSIYPATTTNDQAKQDKQATKDKAKANKGDSKLRARKPKIWSPLSPTESTCRKSCRPSNGGWGWQIETAPLFRHKR